MKYLFSREVRKNSTNVVYDSDIEITRHNHHVYKSLFDSLHSIV